MNDTHGAVNTTRQRVTRDFAVMIGCLTAASMFGTAAFTILPALAPAVARSYGIPAVWIGYQFALVAAFMTCSLLLLGNASRRWGAGRVVQCGIAAVAIGLALILVPHGASLLIGSAVMGLGYGLIMPANSHLMMRFTPRANLNLVFSVQQTGIPLGAILAASVAPVIAVASSWQWAVAGLLVPVIGLALVLGTRRAAWDDDRDPAAELFRSPFAGLALVLADPRLRNLSVSGFCFSGGQFCVATYTVVALVEGLGYGLIEAGMMLSLSQLTGVMCRLYCGWIADRNGNSIGVLLWLAAAMAIFGSASLVMSASWPLFAVCILFAGFGATTVGWPGTYLAEVARLCPPGQVSSGTSGSLLFTNAGKLLVPLAFVAIQAMSDSYSLAFGMIAGLGVVAVIVLLKANRAHAVHRI